MAAKRRERPVAAVERILYTREEAATALGMSVDTFERRVQPFIRVVPCGAPVQVPPEELRRWARDNARSFFGTYVRHQARCPAGSSDARCRCQPSYRGRRWASSKQGMVWSATFRQRAEVLSWLASTIKGQEAVAEAEAAGPTFGDLASEWLDGVHSGAVGRRRGRKGTGYSWTTLDGYERSLTGG
jgi:hypothetical protein